MHAMIGGCRLELHQGDVTHEATDAIVNAANTRLQGGSGVDGAIHARGGPAIMAETDAKYPEGCPTGSAVISGAGDLPARYVIHAVGPVWRGGSQGEPALLAAAYRTSLELAVAHGCESLAFPSLSTGAFGYPIDLASRTALATVRDFLIQEGWPARVRFVLFDSGAYGAFARALEELTG